MKTILTIWLMLFSVIPTQPAKHRIQLQTVEQARQTAERKEKKLQVLISEVELKIAEYESKIADN